MRTTLAIKKDLLQEAKLLANVKSNNAAVEKALEEFVRRRKARKLLELEGKVELSYSTQELLERRRKDVPYR
jgi:Arc/MetJ family transcription regulator